MKLTKLLWGSLLLLIVCLPLAACGEGSTGDAKNLTFWSAANPPQQAFWTEMAKAYMAQHSDIKISVKAIPETPTSEASIQAALAGGTAPTASENIFTGFGGQLQSSQAIAPLDQMPGWNDVIKARHMDKTIASWKFSDGHTYILPMYTNAMLFGWRMDILRQIGYNEPPRTYSQVIDMGQKLKQKFPDKFVWARDALVKDTWYERWFDFFSIYDAASNGQNFISGGKITANEQAAVSSLSFLRDLSQKKLLLTQTQTDAFETGLSVMDIIGPWRFATWQQKYPNLKLNDTYVLTPPPVPDAMANSQAIKTFADAKGLAIYKQASSEQQNAIWEFVKWVLSDPQHDLQWLQTTSLPSARDDLSTNATFKPFFDKNPELVKYAENIPNAVPPIAASKYTDIQVSLGDQAVIPVVKGDATPQQAWNSWKTAVQPMLNQ
ncbi:sugar ABC transporter substrate-binding protein [Ktedonobacter robiniae]|uniref:Sugar ABC transporter substrate-binding protein n=1 Tax=Ktedonobacter robiniae TaxID=2778365 RepID=A0ABQ3V7K8_9CHLR|nr:extracellular solute-binding protein [Ktedonobacter robiniae]GHO60879.1 sugar ABC transporter substrate-binding protein [Ktedonobacter robiniae]